MLLPAETAQPAVFADLVGGAVVDLGDVLPAQGVQPLVEGLDLVGDGGEGGGGGLQLVAHHPLDPLALDQAVRPLSQGQGPQQPPRQEEEEGAAHKPLHHQPARELLRRQEGGDNGAADPKREGAEHLVLPREEARNQPAQGEGPHEQQHLRPREGDGQRHQHPRHRAGGLLAQVGGHQGEDHRRHPPHREAQHRDPVEGHQPAGQADEETGQL